MIPINLEGKVALVTGVGDTESFAWAIAKTLQAAGARIILAVHPRMKTIVESIMTREQDAKDRKLPFDKGDFQVEKILACDVSFDSMEDVDEKTRNDKRYNRHGDFTIAGMIEGLKEQTDHVDIVVHSIAFSPEIKNRAVETSRQAYWTALSVSAYSLTALMRPLEPFMADRPEGAAAIGLTYLGGDRVVPHYGGGMSTAKAALQIDAKQLASNLGPKKIRVNLISAGPYASRAAKGIGNIQEMIDYAAERSPLQRGITAQEVANTAAFLCCPLASGITGEVVYVDCGYNTMGV